MAVTVSTKMEVKTTEPPSDHRGSGIKVWDVADDGARKEVGLLFQTFQGYSRGGDYHGTTQYNVIANGRMKITFGSPYGDSLKESSPVTLGIGETIAISPLMSHILESLDQNTVIFDQRVRPVFQDPKDEEYWGPTNTRFDQKMRKMVTDAKPVTGPDAEKKDYLKITGNWASSKGNRYRIEMGETTYNIMEFEKFDGVSVRPRSGYDFYAYVISGMAFGMYTKSMTVGNIIKVQDDDACDFSMLYEPVVAKGQKLKMLYWEVKRPEA